MTKIDETVILGPYMPESVSIPDDQARTHQARVSYVYTLKPFTLVRTAASNNLFTFEGQQMEPQHAYTISEKGVPLNHHQTLDRNHTSTFV